MNYAFQFDEPATQTILEGLSKLPYERVNVLIGAIVNEAHRQEGEGPRIQALEKELRTHIEGLANGEVFPAEFNSAFAQMDGDKRVVFRTFKSGPEILDTAVGDFRSMVGDFMTAVREKWETPTFTFSSPPLVLYWRQHPKIEAADGTSGKFTVRCRFDYTDLSSAPTRTLDLEIVEADRPD